MQIASVIIIKWCSEQLLQESYRFFIMNKIFMVVGCENGRRNRNSELTIENY